MDFDHCRAEYSLYRGLCLDTMSGNQSNDDNDMEKLEQYCSCVADQDPMCGENMVLPPCDPDGGRLKNFWQRLHFTYAI